MISRLCRNGSHSGQAINIERVKEVSEVVEVVGMDGVVEVALNAEKDAVGLHLNICISCKLSIFVSGLRVSSAVSGSAPDLCLDCFGSLDSLDCLDWILDVFGVLGVLCIWDVFCILGAVLGAARLLVSDCIPS